MTWAELIERVRQFELEDEEVRVRAIVHSAPDEQGQLVMTGTTVLVGSGEIVLAEAGAEMSYVDG
jgi:hypothetical protein